MAMQIGAVVMASGVSARFGGRKLLAPFAGKPLLAWTLAALPETLARRVVVARDPDVCKLARALGCIAIPHALPHRSDTIRLGIEAVADLDGALFCVGDQPLLTSASIEKLLARFERDPQAIVRPCVGERDGNPVLFPAACFPALAALAPGETGAAVIRANMRRLARVPVADVHELDDIDTPDDLRRLASCLAQEVRYADYSERFAGQRRSCDAGRSGD